MYSSSRGACEFELNPYESFMRNHLKHYGYYTGKNDNYRTSGLALADWERSRSFSLSDHIVSDTEYENQALNETKLDDDNRFTDGHKRTTQLVFSHSAGKLVPKLKEPRNLYALSKEAGPQQAPRWPADMEVLPEPVQQISYIPKEREPFYQPTGFEKMPMTLAEGDGRTVYYNPASKDAYFLRSRVGGSRKGCLPRSWKTKGPEDTTLIFESRFESGNLMKVTQRSEFEYDLQLRYDLYTEKHTQWFYFRVQNMRKNIKYRFTITNFMKPGSLYNCGMKPLMYSDTEAKTKKIGWRRLGDEIKYYKNDMRRTDVKGDRSYYSLTWICQFPHDGDTCYFAHCYPYTYSDLQEYLLRLSNDPVRSKYCKQRVLCRSLAGNLIYILTITSAARNPEDAKRKKAVVLTARVHPGETNASWMMKGFLDYLTSDSIDAKLLRDTFVFKIVPMLNPDGVIVGNYRCSLAGRDLNRNYRSVLKDSFPSVSNTKSMIKKLLEEREVAVYCDLHGHSRKQNVFMYGCENKKSKKDRLKERIFPIILGKNAAEKFSVSNCKYKVQKNKEGTGRVVMWQMGIMNSYTMEATFCGSTLGDCRFYHFRTVDYEAMGYHFCDSLLDYCDPDQTKSDLIYKELEQKLREDILNHLERIGTPLPEGGTVDLNQDYTSGVESSTTGSDSSADDGLPVHLIALAPKLTKKKKLKTRKERDKKRNSLEKSKEKIKEEKEKSTGSGKVKPSTPKKEEKCKKPSTPKLKEAEESEKTSFLTKKGREIIPFKDLVLWTDLMKDQTLKYKHASRQTVHSAGRARHIQTRSGDGLPVFTRDRSEDKNIQKTEYLEALTNAYLMSGVLKSSSQDVPSFRYTPGGFDVSSSGLPLAHLDGLCPHHEKAFADRFMANQLSGLTFEEDKTDWNQPLSGPKVSSSYKERRSATPSKSTQFSLVNMATMRSQSESPPHYQPLPLDEYIRPTSRQGPSIMTGSIHRPNTPLRSGSRGPPDVPLVEALITLQRPGSFADFVRRDVEVPSSPQPTPKYTSTSSFGLDEYQRSISTSKSPHLSGKNNGHLSTSPPPPPRKSLSNKGPPPERRRITPVFIEATRTAPQNKDANHMHKSVTVLRAHNTPVKVVSGSPTMERTQNRQAMGAKRRSKVKINDNVSPSPPLTTDEVSLRQSQSSALSHHSSISGRRSVPEEPKSHRCNVEATPISDQVVYTKPATNSSHHFKPSQTFYRSLADGGNAESFVRPSVSAQSEAVERVRFRQRAYSEFEMHSVKHSSNFNNSSSKGNIDINNSTGFDVHDTNVDNYNGPVEETNGRRVMETDFNNSRFDSENLAMENVINLSDVSVPDLDLSFPPNETQGRVSRRVEEASQQNGDGFNLIWNKSSQVQKPSRYIREQRKEEDANIVASHFKDGEFLFENNLSRESFVSSGTPSNRRLGRTDRGEAVVGDRNRKVPKQIPVRQRVKNNIISAQDLRNLEDEDEIDRVMEGGPVRRISDIEINIPTSAYVLRTSRSSRGGQQVLRGSPSPPTTPRNQTNGDISKEERHGRFSIGLPGTEMFNHRIISPRSADHYIQVSKLALQYRHGNEEGEELTELNQDGKVLLEVNGGLETNIKGDCEGNYEVKAGPVRSKHHPATSKMVAVVTPMTQRGDPVSQSRYNTKGTEGAMKDRVGPSQVVIHQGGFQGTRTNPSYTRNQQTRKK
ncbi:uncharacterized protein [Apostichopus japonicus]|uniref:uncharacterized protein isoform X2 n=1 Tax=Stichopus japonicus TaxID=307972 RepID=UPI003AB34BA6